MDVGIANSNEKNYAIKSKYTLDSSALQQRKLRPSKTQTLGISPLFRNKVWSRKVDVSIEEESESEDSHKNVKDQRKISSFSTNY